MANKSSKSKTEKPKVTKIKATDSKPAAKKPKATKSTVASTAPAKKPPKAKGVKAKAVKPGKQAKADKKPRRNPFRPIIGYFKGAWEELKLVRWPNRRTTWGMTGAVLLYTALFVAIIILLDLGFSKLLETMIG